MTQFIRVTTAPMPQPLPSPISASSSSEDRLKVPQDRFVPCKYGSISNEHNMSDTASIASSVNSDASFKTADYFFSMPATPPHTTVSPNDNDEGLYLLWTHQLLRERGYEPGRLDDDDDDEQEDEQDNEHNSRGIQVKPSTNDTIMHDMDNDEEEERDSDVESKSSSDSSLTERSIISGSLVATTPDLRLYSTFDDQSIRRRYSYSYKPSMSTSSFYASHRQEEEEQGSSSFSRFLKSCFSSCQ